MTSSHLSTPSGQWFSQIARPLDPRSMPRLARLLLGALLARGRRTVTSWIRAARLSDQFRPCYRTLAAAGKRADSISARLFSEVVKPLIGPSQRILLAVDDTPTPRQGPQVQGAGVHHNPTPGPAGSPCLYGHVFVVLGLLLKHPSWGSIALPLLFRPYVRQKDLPAMASEDRPEFRTKLELAVEMLRWAQGALKSLKVPVWVVADGAYASAAFLKPAMALEMTVVSRLRKDAALRTVPPAPAQGQRGRPRIYGVDRIDLAVQAGPEQTWSSGEFELYGEKVTRKYRSFLATWRPAGGVIRVVLVEDPKGFRAYFCTDADASVGQILEAVADRFSLEIAFRDLKEVVGAGQQQVRRWWASVGAFGVCLWIQTMTEAWAWTVPAERIVDRSASPWDVGSRRPSHADKRKAWRRELLGEEIRAVLQPGTTEQEVRATAERLLNLAA